MWIAKAGHRHTRIGATGERIPAHASGFAMTGAGALRSGPLSMSRLHAAGAQESTVDDRWRRNRARHVGTLLSAACDARFTFEDSSSPFAIERDVAGRAHAVRLFEAGEGERPPCTDEPIEASRAVEAPRAADQPLIPGRNLFRGRTSKDARVPARCSRAGA